MLKNSTGIPLSVAVWLATDSYDYVQDPNYISATSLLKPLKSIILSRTVPISDEVDIADLVPSRMGTAIHDQIERAWLNRDIRNKALKNLGYPDDVIKSVVINPTNPAEGFTHVYMEKRSQKQIGKWTIGGKFDFVAEGKLTDFKSTKTYSFISGSNNDDYVKQGSIYRWLNPDIITSDIMGIVYIFTDWIHMKSVQDKNYPQKNIIEKNFNLLSEQETENFIKSVLDKIEHFENKSQADMPACTPEELWQSPSVWKYFKDPNKRARSTKNFDNANDAHQRNASDGGMGVVVEVPGEVKRCKYCNARPVCLQAEQLEHDGLLK